MNQQYTSKATSINKNKLPAIFKLVEFKPDTRNLDYGGGKFNNQTEYLKTIGVENFVFDPYNRTANENHIALKSGPFDTITISNVLNVIKEKEIRLAIIKTCLKLLKDGGTIYITVYEGNKSAIGKVSKTDCWQNNQRLDFYAEEIKSAGYNVEKKSKVLIIK